MKKALKISAKTLVALALVAFFFVLLVTVDQQEASHWAKAQDLAGRRHGALKELQHQMQSRGYDFTATSVSATEIEMTSRDFGSTDHRVQFLLALHGLSQDACSAGSQNVWLSTPEYGGFRDKYSLCYR